MQKQSYKKLLSTLITSLLILSVVSAIVPASAGDVTVKITKWDKTEKEHVEDYDGNVGDEFYVQGTIDTVGGGVDVYWDNLGNRVAGAYAKAKTYNISITIPEDIAGAHTIIVVDNTTKDYASKEFKILSKITLDPEVGLPGDEVTVEGTGFGDEVGVTAVFKDTGYAQYVVTTAAEVETSELGSFSATFDVPDFDYGSYKVEATDDDGNSDDAAFEIGAAIYLDPPEGPSGTVVTITGRGFTETRGLDVTVTVSDTGWSVTASQVKDIETKYDGTFTGEVIVPTVPEVDEDEGYTEYTVTATDGDKTGTLGFDVTGNSSITLTPETGFPGSDVIIEGINFTAIEGVEVTVKFGAVEVESLFTNATGGFKGTVTAPNLVETFTVNCTDEYGVYDTTKTFTTKVTGLYPNPTYGPVGEKITLTAYGLTGDKANVTLGGILVLEDETVSDLLDGTSIFWVPTMPAGIYEDGLTVEDDDGFSASTDFDVTATTTLTLDPSTAPVKYNVTITGENFAPDSTVSLVLYNSTYDLEMENVTWESGLPYSKTEMQTDEDGVFEFEWNVTDLALGNYWINATDDFDIYPDKERLIYVLEVPLKVVEATLVVYTGTSEYMRGQYARFFAKTSFETTVPIELTDPTGFIHVEEIDTVTKVGVLYLGTSVLPIPNDAELGTWTWIAEAFDKNATGSFNVVEEITVGTIEERVEDLEETINALSVIVGDLSDSLEGQAAEIDALGDAINTLSGAVDTLKTEITGIKTDVSTGASASAAAKAAAAAAEAAASAAQSAVSALSTPVSESKSAAAAAQSAAEAAQSAVSALGTEVSEGKAAAAAAEEAAQAAQGAVAGLSTTIYGVLIIALIAAIAGILATVQIQRKVVG